MGFELPSCCEGGVINDDVLKIYLMCVLLILYEFIFSYLWFKYWFGFQERDAFLQELAQCELVNRMQGENLSDVLEMWREGTISDWEYLTQLNKMAGRSYNDLMQYPVFPFVLADYTSTSLDLNDAKSYRNFKKPMAIQNKCNEQHYIDTYNVRLHKFCVLCFLQCHVFFIQSSL